MNAIARTTLAVIIIVVVVVAGAASYLAYQYLAKPTATTTPAAPKEIVIGLIEPLTGSHAIFGQEARQAAELVVDIINNELGGVKSLGGAKLRLVVEDAGENPDTAALAAQRLISTYHPVVILGAYISRLTLAIAQVTEQAKVILVSDALVDSLSQQGFMYFFRVAPIASAHGKSAVDFVVEMADRTGTQIKRVVIINEDSIFGTTVSNGAHLEAVAKGLEVAAHITYPYTIADFSPIIDQIRMLKPDIIIAVPYFSDGVLFAKQFAASGIKVKFIAGAGACGFTDPDSIKAAGDAVLYYTNTYSYNPYKPTDWNKKIVQAFQQRYGKLPTEGAGIIFYSLFAVYEALEAAGKMFPSDPLNPDNLRQAFLSLDLNETNSIAAQLYPSGRIKFAPNGDNLYPQTAILQVQLINGTLTPVVVWPQAQPGITPVFPRP
ncbi:MAG: ABC transporter substrate-binding protein [Desulfurococcaceae archaeon]